MKFLLIIAVLLFGGGSSFGQALEKGSVIGMQTFHLTLHSDKSEEDYQDYVEQHILPEFDELEGVNVSALKGYKGGVSIKFCLIYSCESVEVRNRYWPGEKDYSEEVSAILDTLCLNPMEYVTHLNFEWENWWVVL